MKFFTSVEIPVGLPKLTHYDNLLLMGSCFTVHIGMKLRNAKFHALVNPYGVLYNPLSISTALREALAGKVYTKDDLYEHNHLWHSPMHHGDFSASKPEEACRRINISMNELREALSQLNYLLLTGGTAWVYEDKDTGHVVGNCHKLPERYFNRRLLSVKEIVDDYTQLLMSLWSLNPELKVIFTVSPIRHLRDGLHNNQLSKATLLLAFSCLEEMFPQSIFYFPAYEIILDELRDYRFYASDMTHPSEVAIDYVWERFCMTCLSEESLQIMNESGQIYKSLEHKPFHPESESYKTFLEQTLLKIERLNGKYPYLDFQKERNTCLIQLNKLQK